MRHDTLHYRDMNIFALRMRCLFSVEVQILNILNCGSALYNGFNAWGVKKIGGGAIR